MKKIYLIGAAALAAVSMLVSSCGNSEPKPITEKAIVEQVNQLLADEAESELYSEIAVGTYECNDPMTRLLLAKLEVAGLIDYEVTRYAWWEKAKRSYKKAYTVYYGWWGYETRYKTVSGTSYDFEDHYIVTVELTRKGQKLAVDTRPEPVQKVDEDLVSETFDASAYKWEQADLSETWENIPNPFLEKKESKTTTKTTNKPEAKKERKVKEAVEAYPKDDPTIRRDSLQHVAYMNIDENKQLKYLKVGVIKAIKARNIQVLNNYDGLTAVAQVILDTEEATDAGRILKGFEDGQKTLMNVEFRYFIDKGWVLVDSEQVEVKPEDDAAKK